MLAGIITSPSAFSPRANPQRRDRPAQHRAAEDERAGRASPSEEYDDAIADARSRPRPTSSSPEVDSLSPYFTEWLRQQLVDKYGAGRAFGGGLDVKTTLDLDMQEAAEGAAYNTLAGIEPTASVVVIDNETGGVKAMVGGNDFEEEPFNLATNGHRQPGSSFKPFTLITALRERLRPRQHFHIGEAHLHRAELGRQGVLRGRTTTTTSTTAAPTWSARRCTRTTRSSPSSASARPASAARVPAEGRTRHGRADGHRRGQLRHQPGHDPRRYRPGRHAARDGLRLQHDLARRRAHRRQARLDPGPEQLARGPRPRRDPRGHEARRQHPGRRQGPGAKTMRAISESVADTTKVDPPRERSRAVPASGRRPATTARGARPAPPTTTVTPGSAAAPTTSPPCVWVGHAQTNTPMETEYGGLPVDGGTFPARHLGPGDPGGRGDPRLASERRRRGRRDLGRAAAATSRRAALARPRGRLDRLRRLRRRRRCGGAGAGGPRGPAAPAGCSGGATGGTAWAAAGPGGPAASGFDTKRLPAAQWRHGELDRLGDPDAGPADELEVRTIPRRGSTSSKGGAGRSAPFRSSPTPSAWVSLPGAGAELAQLVAAAALAHQLDPVGGLQGADQDGGGVPSGSATKLSRLWMP